MNGLQVSWPNTERVLKAIDCVEAIAAEPADAAPEYWRHVHKRLAASLAPRPCARDRHQAWLQRGGLQP